MSLLIIRAMRGFYTNLMLTIIALASLPMALLSGWLVYAVVTNQDKVRAVYDVLFEPEPRSEQSGFGGPPPENGARQSLERQTLEQFVPDYARKSRADLDDLLNELEDDLKRPPAQEPPN